MSEAWRIVKAAHTNDAFDGEGAWRFGGRWNSRGIRVVYTSATLSLAALENLVHLTPPVTFKYLAVRIEFDPSMVETVTARTLPSDWTAEPPPRSTKRVGDLWVEHARTAVLKVPSVIVESESNYVLNPAHPDFRKIRLGKPEPFSFDPRLL